MKMHSARIPLCLLQGASISAINRFYYAFTGRSFLLKHSKRLQVTAALIITFRPAWALGEFPGGTRGTDETLEDCLTGEIT
jgi:hypothetical protein